MMPNAAQLKPEDRIFALFIGRSGSGKSAAAYSFPGKTRVFDLDGRIRGGLTPWIKRENIDYEYYPPMDQNAVFERLNKDLEVVWIQSRKMQFPYQNIVIDSATWTANDFLLDAIKLTHVASPGRDARGKTLGTMNIAGPGDYQYQSTGMFQVIAFLKSLPAVNVIVTAHIVGRWGKRKDEKGEIIDPYGPSELLGEQLALTDKLAETLPSSFDHVYRFEKSLNGRNFYFEGRGELARTPISGVPFGRIDITGKAFYDSLMAFPPVVDTIGNPQQSKP